MKSIWPVFFSFFLLSCSFNYDFFQKNEDDPNLVMENVEYVRIKNGNPEILVQAKEIRHNEAKHIIEIDNFSFNQYNSAPEGQEAISGINARGKADYARLKTNTGDIEMAGDVIIVVASEDFTMETSKISWEDNDRKLYAPGTVIIKQSNGTTLKGTGFSADARNRCWEFASAVEGLVVED